MASMQEASFRKGKEILEDKRLLKECREIANKDWKSKAKKFDWEIDSPTKVDNLTLRYPKYDAYKDQVAIEHEKKEQMRARWHMMKMEVGFREGEVDVGVMIIPSGEDPSLKRTKYELEKGVFAHHFPLEVPIFVIEY